MKINCPLKIAIEHVVIIYVLICNDIDHIFSVFSLQYFEH